MQADKISRILVVAAALLAMAAPAFAVIGEISDRSLVSKGGILYPQVGDAMQARYQTPPNVKDFLRPGMRLGVLPDDCVSASSGAVGDYYRCDYGLALKADGTDSSGNAVYRVIEAP